MSLDLFERQSEQSLARMVPARQAETGFWDGFIRGTGLTTMQELAKRGRAIDLLGSVGPIVEDAFTGGTEAQDRYFREHDEVWGRAVDYWTPNPEEVGQAAQIAGTLASVLPMVLAAPSLAVGSMQASIGEDLVKKGVDPATAQLVAGAQAAGLGLGIYVPIFGTTLAQRVLYGGIGFNLAQGIGMRASGELLLKGTPAEGEFRAFDPAALTLDVLLGAAFGGIVHLSPAQRAHGEAMWRRMEGWAKGIKSSDLDALTALRQAQHLNVDSAPGKPVEAIDVERHSTRVKTAIEQLVRDQPVEVSDLPAPRFEPDAPRLREMESNVRTLAGAAEEVRQAEGLATAPPPRLVIEDGKNLNIEQRIAETRARIRVLTDPDGMIQDYTKIPDTKGGKVINVDTARGLFDDYREAPWVHSPSVHEPASALMKEHYARLVVQPDPQGLNIVSFLAGGTGAGKTSAVGGVRIMQKMVDASQIVYDTNLANAASAMKKIQLALDNGKQVNIFYVGADPLDSLVRAIRRAKREGRTVPSSEHASTHRGSVSAVQELMERYRNDDRVNFHFLDNTGPSGSQRLVPPAEVSGFLKSFDFDNLEARLKDELDAQYAAGTIDERLYRGFAPSAAEGAGGPARPGAAQEPAVQLPARGPEEPAAGVVDQEVGRIVYRLGYEGESSAAGKWVGTPERIARHLGQYDDLLAKSGDILYAYRVNPEDTRIGKPNKVFPKLTASEEELGAGARTELLGAVPLASIEGDLTAAKIEQAFSKIIPPESEAPAALRGEAVPPPPRGLAPAEAAGAEGTPPALPRPEGVEGRTGTAITERGTEVEVQFRVVEVEDLVTSHDDGLVRRPDYPAEIQPRERGRAASEEQIARIENNLRPELLGENPKASDGAPVVGRDGVVESGNARTIALRRAYRGEKAGKYRAWLLKNAEQFGLKRADLEGVREPMLVRERVTEVDRAAFAREANEAAVAQMSAVEIARADVERMPPLDKLVTNDDGTINVGPSMDFIRDFMESVPPTERPALMTADGALSQAGAARIRNAVFQKAYGDPELSAMMAESTDANVKNILAAMLRTAPEVAKLNELVEAGARYPTNFTQDLPQAVRLFSQLRTDGMPVKTYLSQGALFGGGAPPGVAKLLEVLDANANAPKRLVGAIEAELDLAHGRGSPRQGGLFEQADSVLQAEAERVVAMSPDRLMKVGEDANGNPILKTMREYLDDARGSAEDARADVGLFEAAAQCLLGRAA